MTKEINWVAPVVGKLEVGKTYVDRAGNSRVVSASEDNVYYRFSSGDDGFTESGAYYVMEDQRHVRDLIAEYTPPAPLKMWMNEYGGSDRCICHPTEAKARDVSGVDATRIAVPVTITEGHEP